MLGWCARGQERDELKEDQLWLVVVSRSSFGASATSCQDKQVPSVTHTHTLMNGAFHKDIATIEMFHVLAVAT